jgi:hypothetical protein
MNRLVLYKLPNNFQGLSCTYYSKAEIGDLKSRWKTKKHEKGLKIVGEFC